MKAIENMEVHGNVEEESVNGVVTLFTSNMKKVQNKVALSILEGFKAIQKKFGTIQIYNKDLTLALSKKIVAGALVGTMIVSMTGCSLGNKKEEAPIADVSIAEVEEEETERITYEVKLGDSLWSIASIYMPENKIPGEIKKICKLNDIESKSILRDGTTLKLDIPVSHLADFGYTDDPMVEVQSKEPFDSIFPADSVYYGIDEEWQNKESYVMNSWDEINKDVSDAQFEEQKMFFERERKAVFEGDGSNPGYLLNIALKKDTLETILNDTTGLYNENTINKLVNEINSLYDEAINATEKYSSLKYNDYLNQNNQNKAESHTIG